MVEPIAVLILVVLAVPLAVGIWLIARAIIARGQIEELTRRVEELQVEISKVKRQAPAAPRTIEERIAAFASSQAHSKTDEPERPAAGPPPVPAPATEELFPAAMEIPAAVAFEAAEPAATETPVIPPPPFVPPSVALPPLIARVSVAEPDPATGPVSEPVLETAGASAAPAPEPPPLPEQASFEMRLGTYWLVRIGVVMLLAGFAFFATYAYHHVVSKLGPAGKISLLYLGSGLLLGAGAWWQRRNVKESLKNYAQVLFAGGLAGVYFTTYAAHYIPPLRVIPGALADGTLLFLWAGVIAWIADRRKSEVMALFAVCLAFFTSVITRVGEFTLYSNLILVAAAVFFLVRNRWAGLSFVSLVTSYAGYAFWRFLHPDGWHWAAPDENLWLGAGFLFSYWLVFTAAAFLSRAARLAGSSRAAFLTLNNGALFALFVLTMLQVHTGGFWKFSLAYGAALCALAGLAAKFLAQEPLAKNSYLTQGLSLVTLGFISAFAGLQLALVLGAQSVVLFMLGLQRQSRVLKFFAYAAALLGTGWCVTHLEPFDSTGLWMGTALGVFMVANAFRAHRANAASVEPLRMEPSTFTLLAFANWLATTWFNTTPEHLPLALAAEAVALTASIYLLRIREITLLGQFFLIFAQLSWLFHFLNATPPWWNPLALIAVTIGLSHWWQRQQILAVSRNIFICYSTVFALAAVAVTLVWLGLLVPEPQWLVMTSLLAVAVTGYGLVTRAWPLAICGQIFLAVSAWEFLRQLFNEEPDWYFPVAPMLALAGLSLATVAWSARRPQANARVREPLLQVAAIYRWLALAMSLLWVWDYIPERQRAWTLMLAAAAAFAVAVWRSSREALVAVTVYAAASLTLMWGRDNLAMDVYWPNLPALLVLPAMQQVLRRNSARLPVSENIHGAAVVVAGLSLWRFLSCWSPEASEGFSMTMTWAGFAVAMFAAGIFLRERFYRWFGLAVLATSVGRVVLVDVWKEETIYRVLTFMALGAALLVVGFIYNKYQEKLRQWL